VGVSKFSSIIDRKHTKKQYFSMEKKSVFEEVSRSDPFEQRVSKDEGEIRKRN